MTDFVGKTISNYAVRVEKSSKQKGQVDVRKRCLTFFRIGNPQSISNLALLVLPDCCFNSNSRFSGEIECKLPLSLFLAPSKEEAGYSSYLKWRGNGILIKHAQLQ